MSFIEEAKKQGFEVNDKTIKGTFEATVADDGMSFAEIKTTSMVKPPAEGPMNGKPDAKDEVEKPADGTGNGTGVTPEKPEDGVVTQAPGGAEDGAAPGNGTNTGDKENTDGAGNVTPGPQGKPEEGAEEDAAKKARMDKIQDRIDNKDFVVDEYANRLGVSNETMNKNLQNLQIPQDDEIDKKGGGKTKKRRRRKYRGSAKRRKSGKRV